MPHLAPAEIRQPWQLVSDGVPSASHGRLNLCAQLWCDPLIMVQGEYPFAGGAVQRAVLLRAVAWKVMGLRDFGAKFAANGTGLIGAARIDDVGPGDRLNTTAD
jgi:hypothetical protein